MEEDDTGVFLKPAGSTFQCKGELTIKAFEEYIAYDNSVPLGYYTKKQLDKHLHFFTQDGSYTL